MSADKPMSVVLCWHMHQPEYRDTQSGTIHQPWTYLHAIKDYVDMAAHIEARPGARAVVNFAPILLEQIEDYTLQVRDFLEQGHAIRDPLMSALAEPAMPGDDGQRMKLIQDCVRANRAHMIDRFKPYRQLAQAVDWLRRDPGALTYVSDQFLADLLVWYHLSWMPEFERRSDTRIARLQDKCRNYSLQDRRELLGIIGELLESILPRYRALAEQGAVELAMSPYSHPILPLMLDMHSAREAMPDCVLPSEPHYPGGEARARWQLEQGLATFERIFGRRPAGLWPSEGGVSQATLDIAEQCGFSWAASGGGVLTNSHTEQSRSCRHRVYRFGSNGINCFFRDDGLSDLIGFQYSDWHADDAVADLLNHMSQIADHCPDRRDCLITIILDGENAWEYYPENAWHFLGGLYQGIMDHPRLELTTFSDFLARKQPVPAREERIVAGSWVYGTFSTWIGDPDKNRAWELLVQAKRCFDEVMVAGTLNEAQQRAAEWQLAVCEGSDWFWWFGEYNASETVSQFDQLYRLHLANLYSLLGLEAPAELAEVISLGGGSPDQGGVMRRSGN